MRSARLLHLAAALAASFSLACVARPARFADAPPVTEIADDEPIDVPLSVEVNDVVEFSDLFVGRPLIEAMRPLRKPPPGDINALDDVPVSSWFRPLDVDPGAFEATYAEGGAPVPPYKVLLERAPSGNGGIPVVDALGRRFELRRDPPDRAEVRTAAAAISARIVRALGYLTPEVYVSDAVEGDFTSARGAAPAVHRLRHGARRARGAQEAARQDAHRVAGVRAFEQGRLVPLQRHALAPAIDVGRTLVAGVRGDDINDRVPHENRRTSRAQARGRVARHDALHPARPARRLTPAARRGRLVHYIVGADKSLGTEGDHRQAPRAEGRDAPPRHPRLRPDPNIPPRSASTRRSAPSARSIRPIRPCPPLPPMDVTDGADAYWAARRIAAVPEEMILAVRAGRVSNGTARRLLFEALLARRRQVVEWAYAQTTPCDFEAVDERGVVVIDRAVEAGFTDGKVVEYVVTYIDSNSDPRTPARSSAPRAHASPSPPRAAFANDIRTRSCASRPRSPASRPSLAGAAPDARLQGHAAPWPAALTRSCGRGGVERVGGHSRCFRAWCRLSRIPSPRRHEGRGISRRFFYFLCRKGHEILRERAVGHRDFRGAIGGRSQHFLDAGARAPNPRGGDGGSP
ncbi:MAG: hypothetical protein R3B70_06105 [Polyangiaceae bacterium]